MKGDAMRRREFITLLGGAAAAWPSAVGAQQGALPIVAFVSGRTPDDVALLGPAFRRGLSEAGIVEGQNAAVEYHWLSGRYDQLPSLMADLVRRRVAVIVSADSTPATLAAKAATATIPIVFGLGDDPVERGLVASLARPGGNMTGVSFLNQEVVAKQLSLLHELVPKAVRVAVLVNPGNETSAEATIRNTSEAARALGLQIEILNAGTSREIEAAFTTLVQRQAGALFIAADSFLASRRVQLATLAARYLVPTAQPTSLEFVKAGGLISYGALFAETYQQAGVYTSRILKGAKPADLPVMQSTRFELVINLQTARLLGIEVPPSLLAIADEVIE
jgi:putative ABC transport system substrate-binding protein